MYFTKTFITKHTDRDFIFVRRALDGCTLVINGKWIYNLVMRDFYMFRINCSKRRKCWCYEKYHLCDWCDCDELYHVTLVLYNNLAFMKIFDEDDGSSICWTNHNITHKDPFSIDTINLGRYAQTFYKHMGMYERYKYMYEGVQCRCMGSQYTVTHKGKFKHMCKIHRMLAQYTNVAMKKDARHIIKHLNTYFARELKLLSIYPLVPGCPAVIKN